MIMEFENSIYSSIRLNWIVLLPQFSGFHSTVQRWCSFMYVCKYVKEAWEDIDIPWRWWTNWHSQYKEEQLGNPYIYSICENFESGVHCRWCQPEFVLVHRLNRSPWTVLPKHLSAATMVKTPYLITCIDEFLIDGTSWWDIFAMRFMYLIVEWICISLLVEAHHHRNLFIIAAVNVLKLSSIPIINVFNSYSKMQYATLLLNGKWDYSIRSLDTNYDNEQ